MERTERTLGLASIADRLWALSLGIATEGARSGARGLGIVADEARRLRLAIGELAGEGEALGSGVPPGSVDGPDAQGEPSPAIEELLERMRLLSLNGSIEALAQAGEAASIVALLLGELHGLADEVALLYGLPPAGLDILPEPSEPSETCDAYVHLLFARSGGAPFCENLGRIKEIVRYDEGSIASGAVTVRGRGLRLVRPRLDAAFADGARARGGRRQALVVRAGWEGDSESYAVPVDGLPVNAIARVRLSKAAPYAGGAFDPGSVREAWSAPEGQLVFLDWKALASRG